MTDITVLNSKFETSGKLTSPVSLTPEDICVPAVHQIVKAILASRREGNACTKSKALVSGGGKKPYKQKGTGSARRGSTRSPLMVGGGTMFGPIPRDYTQKTNKKLVLKAIQSVIADKLQSGKLTVVEKIESTGKTRDMNKTLEGRGILPAFLVTSDATSPVLRAARNLQWAKAVHVDGFSVYEAVKFENLVIERGALESLLKRLE
jgi:large subunit ribosomal protein L4